MDFASNKLIKYLIENYPNLNLNGMNAPVEILEFLFDNKLVNLKFG